MMLLEELVKHGLLIESQVPEIIKTAKDKFNGDVDQALVSYNISEDSILELKGSIYNIPIRKIDPNTVTSAVLKIVPVETTRMYHFVPIAVANNVLEIGIIDPDNVQAMDVLTFIAAKIQTKYN